MQAHSAGQATAGWAGFSAVSPTKPSLARMSLLKGQTQWGEMFSLPLYVCVSVYECVCEEHMQIEEM